MRTEWVHCPVCGAKTRDRIGEDTILKNYPLYCPKCKQGKRQILMRSDIKLPQPFVSWSNSR